MNFLTPVPDDSIELAVNEVADEFLSRLEQGESPSPGEFHRRFPQLSDCLGNLLPALQCLVESRRGSSLQISLHSVAADADRAPAHHVGMLGDFRLLREIGRGGMGVVYEAEQISLHRRVALKTFPLSGLLDARQWQRFQREAQAAAQLHHPHIVPIVAIGCERGLHFHALQYIKGHSLAAYLAIARRPSAEAPPGAQAPGVTPFWQAFTTARSRAAPAFFRWAAQLAMQAARALAYAHGLGIMHRGVRPSNLLIDADGNAWISDFGCAPPAGNSTLPDAADTLPALGYWSPEQALSGGATTDHRTDVYGLAASLYELVTLAPVVSGADRKTLLSRVQTEIPVRPARFNNHLPTDLETIVLKGLAKEPRERYATADELADDLERFLAGAPIRARRPTLIERVAYWMRAHQRATFWSGLSLVVALAVCLTVLVWAILS